MGAIPKRISISSSKKYNFTYKINLKTSQIKKNVFRSRRKCCRIRYLSSAQVSVPALSSTVPAHTLSCTQDKTARHPQIQSTCSSSPWTETGNMLLPSSKPVPIRQFWHYGAHQEVISLEARPVVLTLCQRL